MYSVETWSGDAEIMISRKCMASALQIECNARVSKHLLHLVTVEDAPV